VIDHDDVRGFAAASSRTRGEKEEKTMNQANNGTMGEAVSALKHKVRAAAARLPRPIPLQEAAIAVSKQLSPADVGLVVIDTVGKWMFSDTEPVQQTDSGLVLCGPAAQADDEAAWESDGF
jgi:hypothetical protein